MAARHFLRRPACPVCGHNRTSLLFERPCDAEPVRGFLVRYYARAREVGAWLEGGRYRVERCLSCGLIFQRDVPDAALLEELYDRWLSAGEDPTRDPAYRDQLAAPARTRDGHELLAAAALLRRPVASLRVLDYGMGWGLWAIVAQRLGARSYGYDLSESRRRHAARHGVEAVAFEQIATLGVDFINVEQVFEHLVEPVPVLKLLAQALAPGGILKISVPRGSRIETRLDAFDWRGASNAPIMPIHPLEHLNCFDAGALAALAAVGDLSPARIPARAYVAFLGQLDAVPRRPSALAKALARPAYHRFSRTNLYAWFRRPR